MLSADFSDLIAIFRRIDSLVQLPESTARLVSEIDAGDPNLHEIERIISADPALAANVLRAASSVAYAHLGPPVTTLEAAIMRLGLKVLRLLAITFAMQALVHRSTQCDRFDPSLFAQHSAYVAVAAPSLFAQATEDRRSVRIWQPGEMMAAGLLHDLPKLLLAHVAPEVYDGVWNRAQRMRVPYEEAFLLHYGEPLPLLGCAAVCAWHLPPITAEAMAWIAERPEGEGPGVVADCLAAANHAANLAGYAIEEWSFTMESEAPERLGVELEPMLSGWTDACVKLLGLADRAA